MNKDNLDSDFYFNLNNQVAIITGGAGFLGKSHADAILKCGGVPIIADLDFEKAKIVAKEVGGLSFPLELDVTSDKSISEAKNRILKQFGRIDVLINNAAHNIDQKSLIDETSRLEMETIESLIEMLKVNLVGAIACSRTFGNYFALQQKGVILNIASDLGVIAPNQNLYALENVGWQNQPVKPVGYSVSKSGLVGLTKYLSTYWNGRNVRVNAICPGGVQKDQDEEFLKRVSELIPLGRLSRPNEYQALVAFLCSDASSYITGSIIMADGGRSVW